MHETLNADPLKINNSDYTTDWTKQHFYKYYNIFNTEEKKQNNNRNKNFHYKKPKMEDWAPYEDKQLDKDNAQPIVEKEKKNPIYLIRKKQVLEQST
jgi:hypothetical protein